MYCGPVDFVWCLFVFVSVGARCIGCEVQRAVMDWVIVITAV
jgi:hypothetical protein